MKIAIAQLNPIIGDIVHNAQQIIASAEKAATHNVRLLLTPELSLCGYPPKDLLLTPGFIELMSRELKSMAQQLPSSLTVLVGTVTNNTQWKINGEKPLFNSIALLERGEIKQLFHKRLLPTYDVFDEDRYFADGKQSNYFTLQGDTDKSIRIGVTICEDIWNDEQFWGKRSYKVNPLQDLVEQGVDLIVNLSASPYSVGKQKIRQEMIHHSSIRHNKSILYANQVGANDDLIFDGCSIGFNSTGILSCRGKAFDVDLIVTQFDETKKDLCANENIPALPLSTEEEIWQGLVLGLRDYVRKCGFSKIVLGLSGGIDSSLVAVIAAEAIGAKNVFGVLMPSPYSSSHSIADALELAKNLGITSEIIPIEKAMEVYDELLKPLFKNTPFGISEENLQSRIRGNILMALANKFGYLLVSTGNKSEMAVGYCTLYGDMNGGLAVIADVPKTQVFSICKWLNRSREIIPNSVIIKPPSAELRPNQLDRDSLPEYEILDDILDRIIHKHQSQSEIIEAGYEAETVNKVMKLLTRAEFKRRQAPPGLKISPRAFGTGWRMPIASRWLF